MRRTIISTVTATTLLFAASVAVITWATGSGPLVIEPVVEVAVPSAESTSAVRSESAPVDSPNVTTATPSAETLGVVALLPPPPPPDKPGRSREKVHRVADPPLVRYERAQGFRQEVKAGFAALQNRVARCSATGVSLNLEVESVAGGIKILHADVEDPANHAGVSCLQAALQGHVIRAPSVEPGKRWRMPFAVQSSS